MKANNLAHKFVGNGGVVGSKSLQASRAEFKMVIKDNATPPPILDDTGDTIDGTPKIGFE